MQILHGGASRLSLAMLRRSDYFSGVIENRGKRAMLNTNDTLIVNTLQIEADARRARSEAFAAAISALKAKLVARFQASHSKNAQA